MEEVITKIVKEYFDEPEKSLKDVFNEYAENLTEDEKELFFENLKQIIS